MSTPVKRTLPSDRVKPKLAPPILPRVPSPSRVESAPREAHPESRGTP